MAEQQVVPGVGRRCIGFEPFENVCAYTATVQPALLWCERCEALRRKHLDAAFASISEGFLGRETSE